ncbi:MAG: methylmalonyl Co-A mutase-associated GTPase MeaB [Rhodospirillaceae bacterium]|nr:methylmalonyl Co-A mutase-associated GTPase MeaB [Rhodospirillaceae bacterium]
MAALPSLETLQRAQKAGDKTPLASALAELERAPEASATLDLLDAAWSAPRAHVIGLTGPPGVGKSTLAGALIGRWRQNGTSIGVIAVDPSSKRSGGALLGDRTRLRTDPTDGGVFVRSMAARDRLGGLADLTLSAMVLMRALFDRVLVETVGVGQSETDVADTTDTVLFCVQPGSGDGVQFMKAGIVEIPDVVAVTKADTGAVATRTRSDLAGALTLSPDAAGGWSVPVLAVSAQTGVGLDELDAAIDRHAVWLGEAGRLSARRQAQSELWYRDAIRERLGRDGAKTIPSLAAGSAVSPFRAISDIVSGRR